MQELPKFVRGRLAAQAAVGIGAHPDADRLTAFAERTLGPADRSTVLDHLAACADCREIVALALPEVDTLQTVLVAKQSSWLAWSAIRWAFVAVGLVAISSVGVIEYQHHERAGLAVAKFSPMTATLTESKSSAQSANLPAEAATDKNAERSQDSIPQAQPAARLKAHPVQVPSGPESNPIRSVTERSNALAADSGIKTLTLTQPSAAAPAANRVPPPMAKKMSAENNLVASGQAPAALAGVADTDIRVDRAKPASPPAPALWKISDSGTLLRSFDNGQNWQNVNVGPGFVPVSTVAAPATNALAKATDANAPAKFSVRAVAANGAEVWAGGSASLLYHSTDNGAGWIRVIPFSGGARLTGDIVMIDFSDAVHGKISTSTGETWITTDDGQTWQRP